MKRIIILIGLLSTLLTAKSVTENVVMNEYLEKEYNAKVYKKVIILITEARLKLQKKYKKKLVFMQINEEVREKKEMKALLETNNARYYIGLEILKKDKECKIEECKVMYNIIIYDGKKNKIKTIKTKATLIKNIDVVIKTGHIRATTKKLVKFMQKR